MANNSRKKKQSASIAGLTDKILHLFHKRPKGTLNHKQVCSQVKARNSIISGQVLGVLKDLSHQGILTEDKTGKFRLNTKTQEFKGKVDGTARGSAYIVCDDLDDDIYVNQKNMKHAMHGDIVKVGLFPKKGGKLEGEVLEIIERGRSTFVGVLDISDKYAFLIPDGARVSQDFFIPKNRLEGGKHGQKAVVRMTDWPEGAKSPFAEVIKVLGNVGDNDTEIHAILWEFDLPYEFEDKVEEAAEKIPMELDKEEIKNRRDFRDITTFTIDPHDAKDFDDALSIQKLANGNWEIGVHIADVTHYVRPGDIIDKEAIKRATSVYLVDRVVPMLPEKLSNGVCSLRPKEEKFTFSAVFEMDDVGEIQNTWFGRTVIYSDHRFAYEDAQEIIEGADGPFKDEVLTLDRLAKLIRARRFKHGAVNFGKKEVKFNLDEDGKPLGVYFKEGKDANHLIEEFMLLANKKVTEFVSKGEKNKKRTFVFRVHDNPDPDKFNVFSQFIKKLGFGMKQTKTSADISGALNQLMTDIQGSKEQEMIESLAIRTMSKAIYDTKNIGHYGLAFNHYSHFTSPIRRYPDVMVHRLLQHYLDGKKSPEKEYYEEQCKHSSEREKLAADAERASIKFKQVEYLKDRIGEKFEAVISGVSDYGFYAELEESRCEGMVRISDLEDDHYTHDRDNYCLVGKKYGDTFTFGDRVMIEVKRADLLKKQLDFGFIERLPEKED